MTPRGHLLCRDCEGAGSVMTMDGVDECLTCDGTGSMLIDFHTSSGGFAANARNLLRIRHERPTIDSDGDRPAENGRER